MSAWKSVAAPIALVLTAYLLTFSPPFSRSFNSLFVTAVTLAAWNYGVPSGTLAWCLSVLLIVWRLAPWPARGPMSYTSFSSACLVILWLTHRHNLMEAKLKAELDRRRVA